MAATNNPGGGGGGGGLTMQQAQAYYNTLTPQQKAAVDATGGPTIAWLQNAVNAGVPDAIAAAGGTTAGAGGGPGGAPAPAAAGAVPNWGHRESDLMTANYNRLVADGVPPAQAERIVRIAIGGVEHDYAQNMAFDRGNAENVVNQYRAWDSSYDPNCPPDKPYHPDMNHMRQWFPWVPGDAAAKCVEKPHDVPDEYKNAPGGGGQGAAPPAPTEPAAPEAGAAGTEAGAAGTGATPAPTAGGGVTGQTFNVAPPPTPGVTFSAGSAANVAAPQGMAAPTPVPDMWSATGAGGGGAASSPFSQSFSGNRNMFSNPQFFGGGQKGGGRAGWASGGGWVTSDRRLKTLGLEPAPKTRFSDWRR